MLTEERTAGHLCRALAPPASWRCRRSARCASTPSSAACSSRGDAPGAVRYASKVTAPLTGNSLELAFRLRMYLREPDGDVLAASILARELGKRPSKLESFLQEVVALGSAFTVASVVAGLLWWT